MEITNAEITEINVQMKFTVKMTKSLEEAVRKSREEHQSSTETMLQTIMACFDIIGKGESSEAKTIEQKTTSQLLKIGKMPVTSHVISEDDRVNCVFKSVKSKMEAPMFKGEYVEGWIRGMECYFLVHAIAEDSRIVVVMPQLQGLALQWFVWTTNRYNFVDWKDFKMLIGKRFSELLTNSVLYQFLISNSLA